MQPAVIVQGGACTFIAAPRRAAGVEGLVLVQPDGGGAPGVAGHGGPGAPWVGVGCPLLVHVAHPATNVGAAPPEVEGGHGMHWHWGPRSGA